MNDELQNIIEFMEELESDSQVPKNVKNKLKQILIEMKSANGDLSLLINKVLSDLDDISSDTNLDSFTRQQVWSIASSLEAIDF